MRRLILLPLAVIALAALPQDAGAFTVGVQDQGADPTALAQVAGDLGAKTVRVVASPSDPETALIKRYHAAGLEVQAAIVVKKTTTAGDIRGVIRQWHGLVRTVSVGNEPELNGVPACTYARLFARSSAMIRREYPRLKIGFGEFSPAMAFEYIQKIARCHVRIRAAFTAVHPYQFFSDPLGAPTERSGVGTWVGLGNLGAFRKVLRMGRLPARLRATEFSYLIDGRYKIPMSKATSMWPRAIQQARKHVDQLIIYGFGVVPAGTWGSAALLDAQGRRTPAFIAIAKALGRSLSVEHPIAPTGLLPDGTGPDREPPLPMASTEGSGGNVGLGAGEAKDAEDTSETDEEDKPSGAPPICDTDDVSEEDWAAYGCAAFYPDDELPEADPEPGEVVDVPEGGDAE